MSKLPSPVHRMHARLPPQVIFLALYHYLLLLPSDNAATVSWPFWVFVGFVVGNILDELIEIVDRFKGRLDDYLTDSGNYVDWIVHSLLVTYIVLHTLLWRVVFADSTSALWWQQILFASTCIFIWIRVSVGIHMDPGKGV